MWTKQKAVFQKNFKFYSRPAIEQKLIDDFADMYHEMKQMERYTQVARQNAQQAAGA